MAFTPNEEKAIRNHVPTVEKNCRTFMDVFDTETKTETEKVEFLIDLVVTMRKSLKDVKDILNTKL